MYREGASIKAEREGGRERKEPVWTLRGGKWRSSCQTTLTMGYLGFYEGVSWGRPWKQTSKAKKKNSEKRIEISKEQAESEND